MSHKKMSNSLYSTISNHEGMAKWNIFCLVMVMNIDEFELLICGVCTQHACNMNHAHLKLAAVRIKLTFNVGTSISLWFTLSDSKHTLSFLKFKLNHNVKYEWKKRNGKQGTKKWIVWNVWRYTSRIWLKRVVLVSNNLCLSVCINRSLSLLSHNFTSVHSSTQELPVWITSVYDVTLLFVCLCWECKEPETTKLRNLHSTLYSPIMSWTSPISDGGLLRNCWTYCKINMGFYAGGRK